MTTQIQARYQVWHIPQVPGKPFIYYTDDLGEAQRIVDLLADYDAFQYEERIKPDYSNASGISEWDSDEGDWMPVDEDDDAA